MENRIKVISIFCYLSYLKRKLASIDLLITWSETLFSPFSQVKYYNKYLSESSKFGTHQGVKVLEYERVMVIIEDEEASGFLISYDELFGAEEMSTNDKKMLMKGRKQEPTGLTAYSILLVVGLTKA